jgi:hypothetical protein
VRDLFFAAQFPPGRILRGPIVNYLQRQGLSVARKKYLDTAYPGAGGVGGGPAASPGVPWLSVALKYCFKIVVRNRSKKRSKMRLLPSLHEHRYLGAVRLHAENESAKITSVVLAPRLCNPIPGTESLLRMVVMPVLVLACPKKTESEQAFRWRTRLAC